MTSFSVRTEASASDPTLCWCGVSLMSSDDNDDDDDYDARIAFRMVG